MEEDLRPKGTIESADQISLFDNQSGNVNEYILSDLLKIIRHYWILILAVGLVAAVGVIINHKMYPSYITSSNLLVEGSEYSLYHALSEKVAGDIATGASQNITGRYINILSSTDFFLYITDELLHNPQFDYLKKN